LTASKQASKQASEWVSEWHYYLVS
jgi:hypothetical protein